MPGLGSFVFSVLIACAGVVLFVKTRAGNRRVKAGYQQYLQSYRCPNCGAPWRGYRLCSSCKRVMEVPRLPRDIAGWIMSASFVPFAVVLAELILFR